MTREEALLDNIPDDCIWEDKLVNCPHRYVYQSMDEYAKQQAIGFAEWIADGPWVKVPPLDDTPGDIWYIPSDDFDIPSEELTTAALYLLYLTQITK